MTSKSAEVVDRTSRITIGDHMRQRATSAPARGFLGEAGDHGCGG